jgi:hypothetical protein
MGLLLLDIPIADPSLFSIVQIPCQGSINAKNKATIGAGKYFPVRSRRTQMIPSDTIQIQKTAITPLMPLLPSLKPSPTNENLELSIFH